MTIRFTLHCLFKKLISSANTIGAVITERNILTPLRLFVVTMPIQKAVQAETEILSFREKQQPSITAMEDRT
jgi:hypothetical protein